VNIEAGLPKRALLTTISGQDAYFLAKLLKIKGYFLVGLKHTLGPNISEPFFDKIVKGSVTDTNKVASTLKDFRINEIYNLAAKSSVLNSWKCQEDYFEVNAFSVERILEQLIALDRDIKFIQFGSTDMVGFENVPSQPQEFKPWSPYGSSKVQAHNAVLKAKTENGLWAATAMLTNHDSYLRPQNFLMKTLARQIAGVIQRSQSQVYVEKVDIVRDWASAEEIVQGVFQIAQQEQPLSWTLATGKSFSIAQILTEISDIFNIEFEVVSLSPATERNNEIKRVFVDALPGQAHLQWKPTLSAPLVLANMVQWELEN
jgi:GDPmannose 4,6-dehydratase